MLSIVSLLVLRYNNKLKNKNFKQKNANKNNN